MRLFVACLRCNKSLALRLHRIFASAQGSDAILAGHGNPPSRLYVKHPFFATFGRTLGIGALILIGGCAMAVLSPKGAIGSQENTLIPTHLAIGTTPCRVRLGKA